MAKSALVAITDEALRKSFIMRFADAGYIIDTPKTPEELVAMAQKERYNTYLGDINFQRPNTTQIEPFYQVWLLAKERVESGKAKFLTFTSNFEAEMEGTRLGIPVVNKLSRNALDRVIALIDNQ